MFTFRQENFLDQSETTRVAPDVRPLPGSSCSSVTSAVFNLTMTRFLVLLSPLFSSESPNLFLTCSFTCDITPVHTCRALLSLPPKMFQGTIHMQFAPAACIYIFSLFLSSSPLLLSSSSSSPKTPFDRTWQRFLFIFLRPSTISRVFVKNCRVSSGQVPPVGPALG